MVANKFDDIMNYVNSPNPARAHLRAAIIDVLTHFYRKQRDGGLMDKEMFNEMVDVVHEAMSE